MLNLENNFLGELISNSVATYSSALQSASETCLNLVANASSYQINAAIEHNQNEINKMLVQLLTINFITTNKTQIENDIKQIHNRNNNNSKDNNSNIDASVTTTIEIEDYCEKQLLKLSPILGFSKQNYFDYYSISDDIIMDIISYVKPYDIFKSMTLVNKQFNKNVLRLHDSYKYAKLFCPEKFTFQSFKQFKKYYENELNKSDENEDIIVGADLILPNGTWLNGIVDSFDDKLKEVTMTGNFNEKTFHYGVNYWQVAPYGSVTKRKGNKKRFLNLINNGYCNETCDVNLYDIEVWSYDSQEQSGKFVNVMTGNENNDKNINFWKCARIDFGWLINEMNKNENNENEKKENVNKEFEISRIKVIIDITDEYKGFHDNLQQSIKDELEFNNNNNNDNENNENDDNSDETKKFEIGLIYHIDDIDNIKDFGTKTTIFQQKKLEINMFSHIYFHNDGIMSNDKFEFLNKIGMPNYCMVTPNGIFDEKNSEMQQSEYNKWKSITNEAITIYEHEYMNQKILENSISNMYYDDANDKLLVKVLPSPYKFVLIDDNAPKPLKKFYILTYSRQCRFIDLTINDPKLLEIDEILKIAKNNKIGKKEKYFELLKEWKGFIRVSIDITEEFNTFQRSIKEEYLKYYDDDKQDNETKMDEWDNNKYFFDEKQMPYLKFVNGHVIYDMYLSFTHFFFRS